VNSSAPKVTVAVVPRERFGVASACLDRLLAVTSEPHALIYVDGNSPRWVRRRIESRAREHRFTVLRSDRYLSPNQARNLALARTRTPYVVFIDNDVVVQAGWLEALVACADETQASFVSPLIGWGSAERPLVHAVGGEASIVIEGDRRRLRETFGWRMDQPVSEIRSGLQRQRCTNAEFHCILVRTDVARAVGGFDPALRGAMEHVDFSLLTANEAGGGWFEPGSEVVYLRHAGWIGALHPYFWLRWSRAWLEPSISHFMAKWGLSRDDPRLREHRRFLEWMRWGVLWWPRMGMRRIFGDRALASFDRAVDILVSRALVRRAAANGAAVRVLEPGRTPARR